MNKPIRFKRIMKKLSMLFIALYLFVFLMNVVIDNRAYGFIFHIFDKNVVKIHAHLQVVTGPMHYLEEDKEFVEKLLKDKYPGANTSQIELEGELPYRMVIDPAEIGGITVYGSFTGVTDKYEKTGDGIVPVFNVRFYDYPSFLFYEGWKLQLFRIYIFILPLFVVSIIFNIVLYISKLLKRLFNRKV